MVICYIVICNCVSHLMMMVFPILTEGRMEAYHRHQDLRSLFNYFYGWVQNYQSVSSDPRTHSGHHQTSDSTPGITEKVATYWILNIKYKYQMAILASGTYTLVPAFCIWKTEYKTRFSQYFISNSTKRNVHWFVPFGILADILQIHSSKLTQD